MHINVLYFAVLKDFFGAERDRVELANGASVATLLTKLQSRDSGVPAVWKTIAVAVNGEYAGIATMLHEGDEVALLPPVSGGFQ